MHESRFPLRAPRSGGAALLVVASAVAMIAAAPRFTPPLSLATSPPLSTLWLVPDGATTATPALAAAIRDVVNGDAARAVAPLTRAASDPVVGAYARLWLGRAQLQTNHAAQALDIARHVLASSPTGYLADAARVLAADAAEAMRDHAVAVEYLRPLADSALPNPERFQLRLAQVAREANQLPLAYSAFARVYYEHPLTPEASEAAEGLARLSRSTPPEKVLLDLSRAHRFFGGRRYADARKAYEALASTVSADLRPLVELRLAASLLYSNRAAQALEALRPFVAQAGPLQAEAQFYYLTALRSLGRHAESLALVRAFVDAYPQSPLAEQALNELATHYILADDDGKAAEVFAEMYAKWPQGSFADRAAWKAGWWAYKQGNYAEASRIFETASVGMRRADFRPAWLYWAARAHAERGDREAALRGFREVIVYYRNLYYDREAARLIDDMTAKPVVRTSGPLRNGSANGRPVAAAAPLALAPGAPPDNTPVIQALLTAGLYDDAIGELRDAQRRLGTSPLIEATIAFALNRRGELRPGITAMRRAYPQFMAEGGETLPRDILQIIFPLDYWDLIQREAARHRLDPYLMAALVAQESTFDAGIRSPANAWGLMQIIPDTGRRLAAQLGIRPFRTSLLTQPETNVRMGMTYFASLLKQFGDAAPALAAYNAGENRVVKWLAERPDFDRDEFIDDIPFPETQNYVKRILGSAEDYRILYGR